MIAEKVVFIFGTRPEFIKLIPIFRLIEKKGLSDYFIYLYTGQQPDLVEELFSLFNFKPHLSFTVKMRNNSLCLSHSDLLLGIQNMVDKINANNKICLIVGQGDTTTCLSASMAAFMNKIPFAHIEAGLRTFDLSTPFPEEYFRRVISMTTDIHFAPTASAFENLVKEGIAPENILITGNTIVDSVNLMKEFSDMDVDKEKSFPERKSVIISCHRRENQSIRITKLIQIIKQLALEYEDYSFFWLSHSSPAVKADLENGRLADVKNIHILSPLKLNEMHTLYRSAILIISDSGGIQEEAPSFNLPVIVIRDKSERIESVERGYSFIVDISYETIKRTFNMILITGLTEMENPYGDGKASERIIEYIIANYISD